MIKAKSQMTGLSGILTYLADRLRKSKSSEYISRGPRIL